MIKYGVNIKASNGSKEVEHYIESDSLLGCARVISTFQPKTGYHAVKVNIEEIYTMDLEEQPYVKRELFQMEKDSILVPSKG